MQRRSSAICRSPTFQLNRFLLLGIRVDDHVIKRKEHVVAVVELGGEGDLPLQRTHTTCWSCYGVALTPLGQNRRLKPDEPEQCFVVTWQRTLRIYAQQTTPPHLPPTQCKQLCLATGHLNNICASKCSVGRNAGHSMKMFFCQPEWSFSPVRIIFLCYLIGCSNSSTTMNFILGRLYVTGGGPNTRITCCPDQGYISPSST